LIEVEIVRIVGHGFSRERQAGLIFTGLQQRSDIDLLHHGIQRVKAQRHLILGQSLSFLEDQQERA
jgi:hypothetical protein